MAKKISDLTDLSPLATGDLIEIERPGVTPLSGKIPLTITGSGAVVLNDTPTLYSPILPNDEGFYDEFNCAWIVFHHETSVPVNYFTISNNPTGTGPVFASDGADTDIDILYYVKGLGHHWFNCGEDTGLLKLTPVTSAVNYLEILSSVTGVEPTIQSIGSDGDIGLRLKAKGDSVMYFEAGNSDPGDTHTAWRFQLRCEGAPAASDFAGSIYIDLHNSANAFVGAAALTTSWITATAGSELASLLVGVAGAGACVFAPTDDGLGLLLGNNVTTSFNGMFGYTPGLLLHASQAFYNWADDNSGRGIFFNKSRGTTPGDYTIVQEGDIFGRLYFGGADGTDFQPAAAIIAFGDGTPSAGNVPGSMSFQITREGGSALVERLRLYTAGQVQIPSPSDSAQSIAIAATYDVYGADLGGMCLRSDSSYNLHLESTGDLMLEADTDVTGLANIIFTNSQSEIARFDSSNRFGIGRSPSNAMLDVNGAIATRESRITSATTETQSDVDSVIIFSSASTKTITLVDPTTCPGRWLWVKNIGAGALNSASSNVCPATTNTPGTVILTAVSGRYAILQSDGSNWVKLAGGTAA